MVLLSTHNICYGYEIRKYALFTKGLQYLENEEVKGIIMFYKDNYFEYLDWAGGSSTLIKYYKFMPFSFVSYQYSFNF